MKPAHFAEHYCDLHKLTLDEFPRHLRKHALYPHARFIVPILTLFNGDYLAADNDFIQDVGQLTRYNDFFGSSFEYIHHPANRGFLRRVLRLRISTERMRRIIRKGFGAQVAAKKESMTPFSTKGSQGQNPSRHHPEQSA